MTTRSMQQICISTRDTARYPVWSSNHSIGKSPKQWKLRNSDSTFVVLTVAFLTFFSLPVYICFLKVCRFCTFSLLCFSCFDNNALYVFCQTKKASAEQNQSRRGFPYPILFRKLKSYSVNHNCFKRVQIHQLRDGYIAL